ncbi:hypothetical protein M5D96_006151 [Drosophila gunungcola]|uniref:Galactosylgalactosylxylosylprotein 3-beta-glucuronosyltransferase n=1 Tax=Drosophila gunungcola TaxID=103775 RepID=A0A9P9YNL4_9MUSC|nr:hypothetical protein M5D96_006151 [Drosophila gunungcola]
MKGNYINLSTHSGINGASGSGNGNGKMSLGKSIKMYLTIFIATTCIYMVLYQYHISREPFAAAEVVKFLKHQYQIHNNKHNNSSNNKNNNNNSNHNSWYSGQSATEATFISSSSELRSGSGSGSGSGSPPLYIITPTYRRPEQLAELTRLGYTLKHVVNLLWLVIEDANKTNPLVAHTLDRIGVPYEYMVAPMPEKYKQTKRAKPRGVSNRNRGLEYLRHHATEGVLYFADDDNTYDISIFEQMRYITKVAMWPVGLVTKTGVSSPIIQGGKLVGFYDGWIGGRRYPVDMAGFAVSVKFLKERPKAQMPFKPGYEEDGFLRSLAPLDNKEIELLADECRDILTWHTQTKKNAPAQALNRTRYKNTNLEYIDKLLVRP